MFVHTVYFWLKPSLTAEQRMQFVDGLKSLISIKTVRFGHFGKPADTDFAVGTGYRSAGIHGGLVPDQIVDFLALGLVTYLNNRMSQSV